VAEEKERHMATGPRKRQKKLERRSAKRQEKKHKLVRAQPAGLADRLTAAAKQPVLHAFVPDVLETEGIGSVLLSRFLPDGSVAVAVFLVDRYLLGVKNAFFDILTRSEYETKFMRQMRGRYPARDVSPAYVRKLVEDVVAYAGKLGFAPHPDYHKAKLLFGDIDPSECREQFEFGKNGKPYYFAGPNDTLQRSQQIISLLTNKCGPGGFDYVVPFAAPGEGLPGLFAHGPAVEDESENLLEFEDELPDES
jgi:hypothetical protein